MFRDLSRIALAIAVVTIAVLAGPAGASGEVVDDYYNEGIEPHADLGLGTKVKHPSKMKVEFSGSSADQRINSSLTYRCYVRGKARLADSGTFSGWSPFSVLIPIKRRFDFCRVTAAEARYNDPFVTGWLRIRIFGSSR